jgi:plastocyanin
MKFSKLFAAIASTLAMPAAMAGVYPQCPFDINGPGIAHEQPDGPRGLTLHHRTVGVGADAHRQVCLHVVAGDGWQILGDGTRVYGFGFAEARGVDEQVMINGTAAAKFPAPTVSFREGDEVWMSLTNVGMIFRPDLFDQHSIHWHGYPNASAIFDGVPQASATVQMGSTFTYYYKVNDPGTYLWHCHVEATEHMEMGMIGMLNVRPRQDGTPRTHAGKTFTTFAYNDGDGATGYDRQFSLQLGAVDSNFHQLHEAVQPLPFLELKGNYAQLNGRGYPMTTLESVDEMPVPADAPEVSQLIHSVVRANVGDRVLLRVTNGSIDAYYTVTALGLPMQVVGRGAQLAAGPDNLVGSASQWKASGARWAHGTASVTLGGGDGVDLLIDTRGLSRGTYYLYTTNLNYLSNGEGEDRGGLMTTIVLQ